MLGLDGKPPTRKVDTDAEGLRIVADAAGGTKALVSFEQTPAVRAFAGPDFAAGDADANPPAEVRRRPPPQPGPGGHRGRARQLAACRRDRADRRTLAGRRRQPPRLHSSPASAPGSSRSAAPTNTTSAMRRSCRAATFSSSNAGSRSPAASRVRIRRIGGDTIRAGRHPRWPRRHRGGRALPDRQSRRPRRPHRQRRAGDPDPRLRRQQHLPPAHAAAAVRAEHRALRNENGAPRAPSYSVRCDARLRKPSPPGASSPDASAAAPSATGRCRAPSAGSRRARRGPRPSAARAA